MVNKKVVIIVSIFAMIIIGFAFGFKIYLLNKQDYVESMSDEVINNSNPIKTNNNTDNSIENNVEEKNSEEEKLNETNSTNTVGESKNNITSDSTKETLHENSPEEEAIELAKKKWGNKDPNIYFYAEEENKKGVFIVSVRDSDTTAEIKSYIVDTNKKNVTEN